jgi:hypothetical protein
MNSLVKRNPHFVPLSEHVHPIATYLKSETSSGLKYSSEIQVSNTWFDVVMSQSAYSVPTSSS